MLTWNKVSKWACRWNVPAMKWLPLPRAELSPAPQSERLLVILPRSLSVSFPLSPSFSLSQSLCLSHSLCCSLCRFALLSFCCVVLFGVRLGPFMLSGLSHLPLRHFLSHFLGLALALPFVPFYSVAFPS